MWFFFKKSILKAQLFKNAIWSSQSLSVLSPKLPNLPASFIFRTWDTTESQDASDLHCLSRPAEDPPGAQPTYRSAPGQAQPLGLERQLQLGTIELSVSFSPKQSDLFYFFLKGNIPAWAIWFFLSQFTTKTKSQRWGCYCVQHEQNLLGPQGPFVQRKLRKCSFWCFYSKVDPNLKTVVTCKLEITIRLLLWNSVYPSVKREEL